MENTALEHGGWEVRFIRQDPSPETRVVGKGLALEQGRSPA